MAIPTEVPQRTVVHVDDPATDVLSIKGVVYLSIHVLQ